MHQESETAAGDKAWQREVDIAAWSIILVVWPIGVAGIMFDLIMDIIRWKR